MRNRWAGALRSGTVPARTAAKSAIVVLLALQWHWSIEDTEARLLEVSEKARDRVRLGDPRTSTRRCLTPPPRLPAIRRGQGLIPTGDGRGSEEDNGNALAPCTRRCTVVQ